MSGTRRETPLTSRHEVDYLIQESCHRERSTLIYVILQRRFCRLLIQIQIRIPAYTTYSLWSELLDLQVGTSAISVSIWIWPYHADSRHENFRQLVCSSPPYIRSIRRLVELSVGASIPRLVFGAVTVGLRMCHSIWQAPVGAQCCCTADICAPSAQPHYTGPTNYRNARNPHN